MVVGGWQGVVHPALAAMWRNAEGTYRLIGTLKTLQTGLLRADSQRLEMALKVPEAWVDEATGTVPCGMMMAAGDEHSSVACILRKGGMYGVTINLEFKQNKTVRAGDRLVFQCDDIKVGRTMGMTSFAYRNADTGDVIGEGTHTKYMPLRGAERFVFEATRNEMFRDSWIVDYLTRELSTRKGGQVPASGPMHLSEWRRELGFLPRDAESVLCDLSFTPTHVNPQISVHGGSLSMATELAASSYRAARGLSSVCKAINITVVAASPVGRYQGAVRPRSSDATDSQLRVEIGPAVSHKFPTVFGDCFF